MKWYRTMKYKPSFTALVEGKKAINSRQKKNNTEQRGVSKKDAEQIRKVVANAEESNLEG